MALPRLALLVLSWSLPVMAEPVAVARVACDEVSWRSAVLEDPARLAKPRHLFEFVGVRVGKQLIGEWWFAHGE